MVDSIKKLFINLPLTITKVTIVFTMVFNYDNDNINHSASNILTINVIVFLLNNIYEIC